MRFMRCQDFAEKKNTKQYQKRSLYVFFFANIIFKNVCFPIYVPRMTESNSSFLYLRNSATVLVFWLNDMVYCALLIIWLPIPYQTKNCRTKVTQFSVRYEHFVQWKFVQYCFVLGQSNSEQKFLGVTKAFERGIIFARPHVILQKFNTKLLWIKKVFLN